MIGWFEDTSDWLKGTQTRDNMQMQIQHQFIHLETFRCVQIYLFVHALVNVSVVMHHIN